MVLQVLDRSHKRSRSERCCNYLNDYFHIRPQKLEVSLDGKFIVPADNVKTNLNSLLVQV